MEMKKHQKHRSRIYSNKHLYFFYQSFISYTNGKTNAANDSYW